jgi:hypothetical protein
MPSDRLRVAIPVELVLDNELDPLAKYLYMMIRLTKPKSVKELAELAGTYRTGAAKQCKALEAAGWIIMPDKLGIEPIIATAPRRVQNVMVSRLRDARWASRHAGEFLMKAWLDLFVDSDSFIDNCRPSFLVNPATEKPLEYDRLYEEGVAFEYNGRQHYTPTERFSDIDEVRRTQLRDHIKASLSQKQGIVLIEIIESDLNLDNMLANIPDILPLRPIDKNSVYVRGLTRLSEEYVANCMNMRSKKLRPESV